LTPGGSSAVYIYTKAIHRPTQFIWEECGPYPVCECYTLAFALQLSKKHGKTSVRVAEECQLARWNRYILTYLLTPWCRVLLEKLTGLQLVKKFSAFQGTRRFITALTSVRHLFLSWASPIQSIYQHPTSWSSILNIYIYMYIYIYVNVDIHTKLSLNIRRGIVSPTECNSVTIE